MDIDSSILIGVICILIGFLLGLLLSSSGGQKAQKSSARGKELLKVMWEARKKNLLIELGGEVFEKNYDLSRKQRNQIERLILEINRWLETTPPLNQETAAISLSRETSSRQDEPENTKTRLSLNPAMVLVKALQADVKKSQLPAEGMIPQINDILQERLKNSPHITEPVRLMEWPGKVMVIMIGLEKYEGVDDVPDEEIKALIRSAVKAWEQRKNKPEI